jgi:hypothetical protein
MPGILNRVAMSIATTGTGTVTADTLVSDRFNTPAEAGAVDGKKYYWMLEDGLDYELFIGAWTLSGTTVSRDTVLESKISGVHGTSKLNLSGAATLRSVAPGEVIKGTVQTVGDASATVTDRVARVLLTTAFTAARTLTLPAANAYSNGDIIEIIDRSSGGVTSSTDTLTIQRGGTDTVNGGTTAVVISSGRPILRFVSDGSSNWSLNILPLAAGGTGVAAANMAALRDALSAVGVVRTQQFTSSGTYTPDSKLLFAIIECVGGGGGGGGIAGAAGFTGAAAGGAPGGYSRAIKTAAQIGASQTVTIGAAGAAGPAGANNGSAGGSTSVGTLCAANGGNGGNFTTSGSVGPPSAGAVSGTGDFAPSGAAGTGGFGYLSATPLFLNYAAGSGGSTLFGAGGTSVAGNANSVAGHNAGGYGAGGSGAASQNSATNAAGGNGAPGITIITEFCSQ